MMTRRSSSATMPRPTAHHECGAAAGLVLAFFYGSQQLFLIQHRDFIPQRHIQPATPVTSMAPPFSVPPGTPVVKVEEDTNDQELRDMFTEDVRRWLELNRRRSLQSSGSAQLQPPPAPPAVADAGWTSSWGWNNGDDDVHEDLMVQQAPLSLSLPPPPPPPPPPAQHPWAKRPAIGPPPGFAGVRAPPLKQYQRRPPGPNAPVQPPQQPAPPNAHRAPALPAPNAQRAAGHAPQPSAPAGAHGAAATAALPVQVHAAGPIVVPALQRRAAPKHKPSHPAAKKKATVPCTFCGVMCMTAWHLKQHEQGRKHRNRVAYLAGEMNVQCSVCNVHLSSGLNVEEHNAGKQHLLRLHSHRGA